MHDPISSALALVPLALAQSPTIGATELGQWLLGAAAVAVIANQGMAFFRNLTGGFARKGLPSEEGSPSIGACEKKHEAIAQKFETTAREWKADRKDLHARINAIGEGVNRIEGKIEILTTRKP